ncbi:Eukaryotic translation initiation factor 3 subunit B [Tetrabaena socialis]|uniref:Eukaryotic translation initiation factor 3 subunit B n=1 Tax=Tetrabaena socialis TaxID=47790 RepID=A0A2J7ZXQ7_9CHLO|nr:Eukaryotic translation initiation factor 3 subunit B [Tetrabaena socialis]|eukprot:PNH05051.1 Eukaryotic translation initiation factor 3 subunit B [Tetrabaena socialis]
MATVEQALEVARDLFPDLPAGFPYEDFQLEELILPDGDDMGIHSDDDDVKEEDVQTQSGFGSCIVIQNLPKAPEEKYDKLMGVVRTIASKLGDVRDNGIYMPLDDATKMTKGFAFVELARKEDAEAALTDERFVSGYQLDKNHKLTLCRFDDFDKYAKVPDEYAPLEPAPYKQPPENIRLRRYEPTWYDFMTVLR